MEIENATGKLKIVFDTNIFVSSLNKWRGNPYRAYKKLLDGAFIHYTSLEILREITRVLRQDFDWPDEAAYALYKALGDISVIVTPTERLEIIVADPDDNKFLECAVEGEVDCIVSGDSHLLALGEYCGVKVIPVGGFLKLIE